MTDASSWPTVRLGQVAAIEIGRTPSRSNPEYWTNDLTRPFCTIADMAEYLVHPRREGVTALAEHEKKAKRVPEGALLLSFKLTLGRVGLAAIDLFPNEAIAHVSVDPGSAHQDFVAYALRTVDFDYLANDAAKGKTLNKGSLAEIEIPCPDLELQERIVKSLKQFDQVATTASAFAMSASRMRDAALWSAMTDPSSVERVSQHFAQLVEGTGG